MPQRNLRHAILSGSLAPGQPLSLRKIATRLGISFVPVREALRSLEGEGLLDELHTELVRPASTASELRILNQLWRALERYIRAGHRYATDTPGLQLPNTELTYELLAAYRANDPGAVRLVS